jgi:hypothetical protein
MKYSSYTSILPVVEVKAEDKKKENYASAY